MILVDTSVVIDYAKGRDAKLAALLPTLAVAICGVVRAELLCGARDAKHRADLMTLLGTFQQVTIPDLLWDVVGDHLAVLRSSGITVPFPDMVIATLGIHHGVEVWARDLHYPAMRAALPGLRLFQEPP